MKKPPVKTSYPKPFKKVKTQGPMIRSLRAYRKRLQAPTKSFQSRRGS